MSAREFLTHWCADARYYLEDPRPAREVDSGFIELALSSLPALVSFVEAKVARSDGRIVTAGSTDLEDLAKALGWTG